MILRNFHNADTKLSTQMKSVGEVMAIGRTFAQSLQKAIRGLEIGVCGFESQTDLLQGDAKDSIRTKLQTPGAARLWHIADAFRVGFDIKTIAQWTSLDAWVLAQIQDIVEAEQALVQLGFAGMNETVMRNLKRQGFADKRLAQLLGVSESALRKKRHDLGIRPVYKRVDTCSGEFATQTAYLYSTYEEICEATPTDAKKIMVLGGGLIVLVKG